MMNYACVTVLPSCPAAYGNFLPGLNQNINAAKHGVTVVRYDVSYRDCLRLGTKLQKVI